MKFYRSHVKISSTSPPDEILASLAGGFGLWQTAVLFIAIISQFISSLDRIAVMTSVPDRLNFTCADGGGRQCVNANGTICEKFTFFNVQSNATTFTEKFSLVCEKETYAVWLKNSYRVGLVIGCLLTGGCADKFGIKITSMVFISLQCLTGLLVISVSNVEVLIFFMLSHAIFSVTIMHLPVIAVCDMVGNNWRTLALGAVSFPVTIGFIMFPLIQNSFLNAEGILATASVLPLIILIPLSYYKESPNYICLMTEFSKGEETLRQIAEFNRRPISPNIKVRPVQILIDNQIPQRTSFFHIWEFPRTRNAYLALTTIWFCMGYCNNTLLRYTYNDFSHFFLFGVCCSVGCISSIALLHYVPHKMVIAIFESLKCMFTGGIVMYDVYWKQNENIFFVILVLTAAVLQWMSLTATVNLSPRMFPTELRALSFGLCGSVFHIAGIVEKIVHFYCKHEAFYVTALILVLSPVLEIVACLWLWDVHKRELPDFLVDCLNFNTFYKPTRYYSILDNPSQHEIEVIQVDLNSAPNKRPKQTHKYR